MSVMMHLGQTGPLVDDAAWTAYLDGARASMVASWNRARDAYLTLKRVRETLGLPFVSQPGEAVPDPNALSPADDQEFLYLNAVVGLLSEWAEEAVDGKRKGFFDGTSGKLQIESLPSDTMRIEEGPGGRPVIVDMQGTPVPGSIAGWQIVAGLAAVAVAGVALYFTADRMAKALETNAEQKTMDTIVQKQAELVQSGKATPEEAQALVSSIFEGARDLKKAKAEEKETKSGWQQTITTVAWIGFGIAGLIFTAKILPMALGGGGRC